MTIRPIRTRADYRAALKQVERLWDAVPGTPDGDRVAVMVTLIEAYSDLRSVRAELVEARTAAPRIRASTSSARTECGIGFKGRRNEAKHFPIPAPDPIAAIEFMMEQKGLTRRDLEPAIGSRGRVSEVLPRKRPLTLPMVRALSKLLDNPAAVLVRLHPLRESA